MHNFLYSILIFLKKSIAFLLIISLLSSLISCSYYKATTLHATTKKDRVNLIDSKYYYFEGSYFIVHFGTNTWQLNNIRLNGQASQLSGTLSNVDPVADYYFDKIEHKIYSRYKTKEKDYIRQVHLFVDEYTLDGDRIVISDENLVQVEVLDPAFGPTALSYLLVGTASAFAALMIYLLIICNCPHVYTPEGENYVFSHTLFTGALNPALQRSDYQLMPDIRHGSDTFDFIVRNDEEEQQFTDQLELIVAHHQPGTFVLPEQTGDLHAFSNPISPLKATTDNDSDVTEILKYQDNYSYEFDKNIKKLSELYLTFPSKGKEANLILRLKNTLWAGLVYHEFQHLFGNKYSGWVKKNQLKSQDELLDWQKKQGILLSVAVKKENRWHHLEYIELVGEAGYNSLVIPLDETGSENDIEVRLTSGFKFWEIDYAAISFEKEKIQEVQYLKPMQAMDQKGRDHVDQLSHIDSVYMEHLDKGESTHILFSGMNVFPDKERTVILKSNGFYITKKEISGKTKYLQLMKLTRKGEFSVFSKELYDRLFSSTIYLN